MTVAERTHWTCGRTSRGLTVAVWPRRDPAVARLRLVFPAGAYEEPADRYGVASLVAPLLRTASTRHTAEAIDDMVETLGSDVVANVEWARAEFTMDVLSRDLERALGFLCDLAAHPSFPPHAIEALRSRRLSQLAQQARDPATQALDGFFRCLFPGNRDGAPLLGSIAGISSVTRETIAGFHARRYVPALGALIVTGNADPDAVMRYAERYVADVSHAASDRDVADGAAHASQALVEDAASVPSPGMTPAARVFLIDCPAAHHTEIRVGSRSADQGHPDALALQVLGTLLGGTSFSRLTRRLRHEGGYCYYVHSRFVQRRHRGAFLVSTSVPTDRVGRAIADVFDELARVRDTPAGGEEIAAATGQFEAALFQAWTTLTGQADRLTARFPGALDGGEAEQWATTARGMTPDRVMALAGAHLDARQLIVVAAGPAAQVRPQLEAFGVVAELP